MNSLNDFSNRQFDREIQVKGSLDELMRRLRPGMKVRARIVDCLEHGTYILRVWGYNMISESNYPFNRFEEVELEVKEVNPKMVFALKPIREFPGSGLYA